MLRIALCMTLVPVLVSCNASLGERDDTALSFHRLIYGGSSELPLSYSEFAPYPEAAPPGNRFSGNLILDSQGRGSNFQLLVDEFDLSSSGRPGMDRLPDFAAAFVQDNGVLIPLEQGPVDVGHDWWDIVLRPGRVWDEPGDNGFSRASIPFALKERGEDCIHNGMLMFLFRGPGEISDVAFQVSNQTCRYLQFEMWGAVAADYDAQDLHGASKLIAAVRANRAGRMPGRHIDDLADDHPGVDAKAFGSPEEIDPADMSVFGFVIDGFHYAGGCASPRGPYPDCDEMALPSYSTAKSFVAGLGLMLMERHFPGTAGSFITDYVPECGASWDGVTIEHALDMTTGHYSQPSMHGDEDAAIGSGFFLSQTHEGKIQYACTAHPRKADPGQHLSYHTWDTYLAGTAMNARLRSFDGQDADFYRDLLVRKIWRPLGLSLLSQETRRSYDAIAQPFAGYGITMVRDDVAKLLQFLGPDDGKIEGREVLDRRLFEAVKSPTADDPGMTAELKTIRYNNGFRSFDVSSYLDCDSPVWVVTMSGFGGINFVVMPNDTAYYYFSDGNVHRYLTAVRESHKIRPMCVSGSAESVQ